MEGGSIQRHLEESRAGKYMAIRLGMVKAKKEGKWERMVQIAR